MAKILLVEDDTNLSEIYQARMEAEGYDVVSASDGETALAVAAKEKPDLIISDVMMPKISGFEMLDILRNTEELKNTPVIMLTALGQTDDKGRAERLGADRYLVKSQVTLEDIVNAAHNILEGGGATPESVGGVEVVPPATDAVTEPQPTAPAAVAATPVAAPPAPVETPVVTMPVAAPPATDDQAVATTAATDDTTATDDANATTSQPTETPAATTAADDSQPADTSASDTSAATDTANPQATTPTTTPAPHRAEAYEHRPVAPVRVPPATAPASRQPAPSEAPAATTDDATQPEPAPVATDAEQPASQASDIAMDEGVVDHAINQLLNKSPQQPQTDTTHGQVLPSADDQQAAGQSDRAPKKIISPIEKPPVASLDELLAREEARDGADDANARDFAEQATDPALQPPALAAEPAPQAAVPSDAAAGQPSPAPAPAENNEQTPPASKPPVDPNSIAL